MCIRKSHSRCTCCVLITAIRTVCASRQWYQGLPTIAEAGSAADMLSCVFNLCRCRVIGKQSLHSMLEARAPRFCHTDYSSTGQATESMSTALLSCPDLMPRQTLVFSPGELPSALVLRHRSSSHASSTPCGAAENPFDPGAGCDHLMLIRSTTSTRVSPRADAGVLVGAAAADAGAVRRHRGRRPRRRHRHPARPGHHGALERCCL